MGKYYDEAMETSSSVRFVLAPCLVLGSIYFVWILSGITFDFFDKRKVEQSWEYTNRSMPKIRHFTEDCLNDFNGTYILSGDSRNGWTVRCIYQRKQVE